MSDFRSDTVTQPTPRMREAMARAEVGDDVFGEDPTIRRLEEQGAAFLGTEAALFVPSGTMANQVCVHVHCRAGDELVCEERSHVFVYEAGSAARLSGTQVRSVRAERGFPSVEQLEGAVRARDNDHYPTSRLLVLENTHNMAGGAVLPPAEMRRLVDAAHGLGLSVHVDGARVVNAAVASGCSVRELVAGADSVSMCLSKGLGAPVGSLIGGSAMFVRQARRVRKAFGGGMRQAGILAAAGLIALEEGPSLIAEDHRRARMLADGLGAMPGLRVATPETNIVMVDVLRGDATRLLAHLARKGVRALTVSAQRVRFVTHRDVGDADVARCLGAVTEWVHVEDQSPAKGPSRGIAQ
jgi:threonine aldolase